MRDVRERQVVYVDGGDDAQRKLNVALRYSLTACGRSSLTREPGEGTADNGVRGLFMPLEYNKELIPRAKELRKNMTRQESHLWYDYLRHYPVRFQRQKTIYHYIIFRLYAKPLTKPYSKGWDKIPRLPREGAPPAGGEGVSRSDVLRAAC